jgi:hypothetical protein
LEDFSKLSQSDIYIILSSLDNEFGRLIKTVYFQDFCQLKTDVFNSTFKEELLEVCGGTSL